MLRPAPNDHRTITTDARLASGRSGSRQLPHNAVNSGQPGDDYYQRR